jgi:hypothetical protein
MHKMGKIVDLETARKNSLSRPLPHVMVSDPRRHALAAHADKLRLHRFEVLSERERIARNWHGIVMRLKFEYGVRKGDIYQVVQREGTDATYEAQKKSQEYEIRPEHTGADLERRKRKIKQKGERWLRLAEKAAECSGQEKHYWLNDLLAGTELALPSTVPTELASRPIAAVLELANLACAKVAQNVDLPKYFSRWDHLWVGYRHHDQTFVAGAWLSDHGSEPEAAMSSISSRFYHIDNEGLRTGWHDALPLPSVAFAEQVRLGPLNARASICRNGHWTIWPRENLRVSYVREFRLAIGMNAFDDSIAPVIEIRDKVVVDGTAGDEDVLFRPCCGDSLDNAGEVLSNAEADNAGDNVISGYVGRGKLVLPDGIVSCELLFDVETAELENLKIRLDREDARFEPEPWLGNAYYLLSPDNAEALLGAFCSAVAVQPAKPENREYELPWGEKLTHTLNNPFSALGRLEKVLTDRSSDDSFFDRLQRSAQEIVAKFRREYDIVYAQVAEAHQSALESYKPGPNQGA